MRILLVRAMGTTAFMIASYGVLSGETLGLEYIGAAVGDDHDVKILDMRLEGGLDKLKETLESFKPDIVGISAATCEVNTAKQAIEQAKGFDDRILTVVGGVHATMVPEDYIDTPVDVIVIGEGVFTFREIVEHFERDEPFAAIRGIAFRDEGRLHKTAARPMCHPDDLPLPDRSLTSHIRHKYAYGMFANDMAVARFTQGCPYRCEFCTCWQLAGGKYLKRDVENIIEELKTIEDNYIYLADDESLLDRKWSMQLAKRIKEEGICKKYHMFLRADTICANADVVEAWAGIGLSEAWVGIEATSDEDLALIGKDGTTADNEKAAAVLTEIGVTCMSAMMVRPDFERRDFENMWEYATRRELENPNFVILTPLPGTVYGEKVKGQIVFHDYDLYDFQHTLLPTRLDLEEFYSQYASMYEIYQQPVPVGFYTRKLLELIGSLPEEEAHAQLARTLALRDTVDNLYLDHKRSTKGAVG